MTMTGSFQNRIREGALQVGELKVGDGVTMTYYTDRQAATVLAISPSGKTLTIQKDLAIRTDQNGPSEAQSYRYETDPQPFVTTARFSRVKGRFKTRGGQGLIRGRHEYYDYSF